MCEFQVYTGMDYLGRGGSFIKTIIGFFNSYSDSQEYTVEEVVSLLLIDKKKQQLEHKITRYTQEHCASRTCGNSLDDLYHHCSKHRRRKVLTIGGAPMMVRA